MNSGATAPSRHPLRHDPCFAYLLGFALLLAGLMLALWKLGVLAIIGSFWNGVIVLALIGIGIMVSAMNNNRRRVEIDQT